MATGNENASNKSSADSQAVALAKALAWPLVVLVLIGGAYLYKGSISQISIGDGKIAVVTFSLGQASACRGGDASASGPCAASAPAAASSGQITQVAESAAKANVANSRVLWVDDNPDNNVYEMNALEALGVRFDTVTSTKEALERLTSSKYQLVITDYARRDDPKGGETLLADLHNIKDAPPLIIYSSGWTPEREKDVKAKGAFGETNRPVELFQLAISALQGAKK
jgi:CheY-like chemotaxis protein